MSLTRCPLILTAAFVLAACQAAQPAAQAPAPAIGAASAAPAGASALAASATIGVEAAPAAIAVAGDHVYVGSAETGAVTVIDGRTGAVVKTIPGAGGAVSYLGAFDDGRHALVLDSRLGTARVLDPALGHAAVQTLQLGGAPSHAVISPDDPTVMVALGAEARAVLLTFDATDRAKPVTRRNFQVGGAGAAASRSLGYDHGWIAVPNALERTVSLFDLASGNVVSLPGGQGVGDSHMGVWGGVARQAIVANPQEHAVSLFAVPSGERTVITGLGQDPADLQAEENLRRAYVAMRGSDELAVIDYDKKRLFGKVPTGKGPSTIAIVEALAPAGAYRVAHEEDDSPREVWVGNEADGTMTVVDANTLLIKATVSVGKGPHRVAFAGTKAYVANRGDGTVSVVDRTAIR